MLVTLNVVLDTAMSAVLNAATIMLNAIAFITFMRIIAREGVRRRTSQKQKGPNVRPCKNAMAGCMGLEPTTSGVTGRRSNQLS